MLDPASYRCHEAYTYTAKSMKFDALVFEGSIDYQLFGPWGLTHRPGGPEGNSRGWRNTLEVVLLEISNSIRWNRTPLSFTHIPYASNLRPEICFFEPKHLDKCSNLNSANLSKLRALLKIHQRGVQWKQGVVIYMCYLLAYYMIHFPHPLHPPPTAPRCNEYPIAARTTLPSGSSASWPPTSRTGGFRSRGN